MAIILAHESERYLFGNCIFGTGSPPSSFYLRLFSNNLYPAKSNVFADFTQATTPDTDEYTLSDSLFTVYPASAGINTYAEYGSTVTFGFTGYGGSNDYIYGYYIYWDNGGTNRVLVSERFASPALVGVALAIAIKPKIDFGELIV